MVHTILSSRLTKLLETSSTGYLVDVAAPPNAVQVYSRLLSCLRLIWPRFQAVVYVYEPTADQSFFVNMPLLHEVVNTSPFAIHGKNCSRHSTTFVYLAKDHPQVLTGPPDSLAALLPLLVTDHTVVHGTRYSVSISLPPDLTPESSIPLAGVLLEYPVAYVPASDQLPFLSNISLDVYECILTLGHNQVSANLEDHLFLKFSCPSDLAERHPNCLGSLHVIACLTEKFTNRLRQSVPEATIRIMHSRETKDRVAL